MKVYAALPILLSTAGLLPISQAGEIVEVHGSGTTNPSKCIWHLMSLFNARSRTPIRMTYRAVGSSTGQTEFLGVNNTDPENPTTEPFQHWPHTDFGAGDIPVPSEKYNALQDSGADPSYKKMVHLPFALSSVSFFYKLNDVEEIDLSACLLAKIFNREITTWNDPELVKINPSLATKDTDIKVCRRTHGSSSTKSITKFLNLKCPEKWPSGMVGSELDNWNAGTTAVEGSGEMAQCVSENNGAIGYLESGHGWAEGFGEISLENKAGNFVTSKAAFVNGGIQDAASDAYTPPNANMDWGNVNFIDKGGANTFPIVLMSYVYVRRDIFRYMEDEKARGLMKLFLESLYMDEYFGKCSKLAFSTPPTEVKEAAIKGINDVEWQFTTTDTENMWEFEIDTKKRLGAGKYMISSKRQSYQGVVLEDSLTKDEQELKDIENLYELAEEELGYNKFSNTDKREIDAALVLGALSFSLWCLLIIGWFVTRYFYCCGK